MSTILVVRAVETHKHRLHLWPGSVTASTGQLRNIHGLHFGETCVCSRSPLLPCLWRWDLSRAENCYLPGRLFRDLPTWTQCLLDPTASFLICSSFLPEHSLAAASQHRHRGIKWTSCPANEQLSRACEGRAFALYWHDCVFLQILQKLVTLWATV